MRFSVRWIDVEAGLLTGIQPTFMLRRGDGLPDSSEDHRSYWVPQRDLLGDFSSSPRDGPAVASGGHDWSVCRSGEFVRVPLFAYRTVHHSKPGVLCLGAELGMRALAAFGTRGTVCECILVVGSECTDLRPKLDACRCYMTVVYVVQ